LYTIGFVSVALTEDGRVYVWGKDDNIGSLGLADIPPPRQKGRGDTGRVYFHSPTINSKKTKRMTSMLLFRILGAERMRLLKNSLSLQW